MRREGLIVKDFGDCSSFECGLSNFFINDAGSGGAAKGNLDDSADGKVICRGVSQGSGVF